MKYTVDCEFNGYRGPLISMALIAEDGRSTYLGIKNEVPIATDPWVWENVMPLIDKARIPIKWGSHYDAAKELEKFFAGDENPVVIADWPDDIRHFCETILVGPGEMIDLPGVTFEVVRIDSYPCSAPEAIQHNAWWDAWALMRKLDELDDARRMRLAASLLRKL